MMNQTARQRAGWLSIAMVCVLVLVSSPADVALGCGLDWLLPTNHFDGVDSQGHLSYWEKIGTVDCGNGLALPLHINFNSQRDAGTPSPYLGQGWLLALLESKFVQEGEDRFVMLQPDGLNNLFLRRGGTEGTVLDGSAGWKGEIRGQTITAWADCGWKLVFSNGRITSMTTPKGRKLDWVYEGGRVIEVREGSAVCLKMGYDAAGRAKTITTADSKQILIEQDKKPRIQRNGGVNVVNGFDYSLSKMTLSNGDRQIYEFGQSGEDESYSPFMQVTRSSKPIRAFFWNPLTKLIIADSDSRYTIVPHDRGSEITRNGFKGGADYWYNDIQNGRDTIQKDGGPKETVTRFLAGAAAGKIRRIESSINGVTKTTYHADYDGSGNFIRGVYDNGDVFTCDRQPTRIVNYKNGLPCLTTSLNVDGTIAKEVFNGINMQKTYTYEKGLKVCVTQLPDGSIVTEKFDEMHKLVGKVTDLTQLKK